jgi:hypothetical protein
MTLLELAAHAHQPLSTEWLVDHGATPDLLPAWDFGWKDRIGYLHTEMIELIEQHRAKLSLT